MNAFETTFLAYGRKIRNIGLTMIATGVVAGLALILTGNW